MRSSGADHLVRRFRAILVGLLPQKFWERALRLWPFKSLRNWLVGPSDTAHLAEGRVRFERLAFEFAAPYRIWNKARRTGIENRICRLAMATCRSGSVGIDVGANCGFVSLVMAASVGSGGRVLSFEPDDGYYQVLQRNLVANRLDDVCTPIRAYVGTSSSEVGHVCLDDVARSLSLAKVDFIKIDVDGGDFDVLRGAKELLTRWKPVVVVEMTADQDAIYAFLKKEVGYTTFVGMSGESITPGQWPENLIAGEGPIVIPPRGTFT